MLHDSNWLQRTIGITEGHPYQSALVLAGDEQRRTPGTAIFHVGDGMVRFEFYANRNNPADDSYDLQQAVAENTQGEPSLDIVVPSAELRHPVLLTTLLIYEGEPIGGMLAESATVPATAFGAANQPMDHVVVELLDLPSDYWGDQKLTYQHAISKYPLELSEDEKHVLIPSRTLGWRRLSGCTINAGGWTVEIREIPVERRKNERVTHQCAITKSDGEMTGTRVLKFFKEELWPFLCFVFAHEVQVIHMTGAGWTKLGAVHPEAMQTRRRNWFPITRHQSGVLQALFQRFHNQNPETKKHWRKVIEKYVKSEEIIATLGDSEIAEAVSFAGLEGLTRSIINGYENKNQWLNSKLELKSRLPKKDGGKTGIVDAIEMVLRRELATSNPELTEPLKQLTKLRNSTVHTDLQSDPDWSNARHRWNASQALIEMLLLAKMGLKGIPNRTEHGILTIMGRDLYRDVRGEVILPRRCQSCGEWTETVAHRACKQILCSPCCEHHDKSGCTDATYPPMQ